MTFGSTSFTHAIKGYIVIYVVGVEMTILCLYYHLDPYTKKVFYKPFVSFASFVSCFWIDEDGFYTNTYALGGGVTLARA